MARENEISILVKAEVDKAIKDLKQFQKKGTDAPKKVGLSFKKLGGAIGIVSGILTGVFIGGLFKAVKAASNFEETVQKFNVTFRDVQKEADNVAKNLSENFGLSTASAKELLSSTGDLLSGFGFTGEAALDLAKKTNELAADLASFSNIQGGTEAASLALTKGLLGERESMKLLGIAILETDVQQRVLEKGQAGLTGTARRQARAIATLELATEQSGNALGDFARSQGSTANQARILQANLEDLAINIGSKLTPFVNTIIKSFNRFFSSLSASDVALQNFRDASESVTLAEKALTDAIAKSGASSKEAARANQELTKEKVRLESATARLDIQERALIETTKKSVAALPDLEDANKKLTAELTTRTKRVTDLLATEKIQNAFSIQSVAARTKALGPLRQAQAAQLEVSEDLAESDIELNKARNASVELTDFLKVKEAELKRGRVEAIEITKQSAQQEAEAAKARELAGIRDNADQAEQKKLLQELFNFDVVKKGELTTITLEELRKRSEARKGALEAEQTAIREAANIEIEAERSKTNAIRQIRQALFNFISSGTQNLNQILANLDEQRTNDQIAALQAQLDNQEITQEEFDKKSKEATAKQATRDRERALFQIAVDTAVAIVRALLTGLPLPGIPLAAFAAASGAAQAAVVSSQPLPSFQTGVDFVPSDTLANLHEGERVLTREENVNNNQLQGATINVFANDPAEFSRQLDNHVRNNGGVPIGV